MHFARGGNGAEKNCAPKFAENENAFRYKWLGKEMSMKQYRKGMTWNHLYCSHPSRIKTRRTTVMEKKYAAPRMKAN